MKLSVTKAISDITSPHFKDMLRKGAFPEVEFHESVSSNGVKFESVSMFAYSNTHARFMKVVDKRIKEKTGDSYGIFTRKRSREFLAVVQEIVSDIAEADVRVEPERFRSFADNFS